MATTSTRYDLLAGESSSGPSNFTNFNGTTYFQTLADNGKWKIDNVTKKPISILEFPAGLVLQETPTQFPSDGIVGGIKYTIGQSGATQKQRGTFERNLANDLIVATNLADGTSQTIWNANMDYNVLPPDRGIFNLQTINGNVYFFSGKLSGTTLQKIDPTTSPQVQVLVGNGYNGVGGNPTIAGYSSDNQQLYVTYNGYSDGIELLIVNDDKTPGRVLTGTNGDDRYDVTSVNDIIIEDFNGGTDSVDVGVSGYTLDSNVEHLHLQGDSQSGSGNELGNAIYGNDLPNELYGKDGNDYLFGGLNNEKDTLIGGRGNDIYDVDSLGDIVIENLNDGIDFVYTQVDYTLPDNVERLQLYGGAVTGNGNDLNNAIYGNASYDTFNILYGQGGDDYIFGGAGKDTMGGGTGNDIYDVDNLGDVVIEDFFSNGIDQVYASVSGYTLTDDVEQLRLYGNANSGTGNKLDNALYGNQLNDTLDGKDGNDYIFGGIGNDTMIGGQGNDIFDVDNLNDVVIETANEGIDLVYASISGYTIGENVEQLHLYGDATSGNGNSLDNTIYGNRLNDTLNAGAGNDILVGYGGNDILTGGSGNDTFRFTNDIGADLTLLGVDTITDFTVGQDKIDLNKSIFANIQTIAGNLSGADFSVVTTDALAGSSGTAIAYNSSNGKLFYNAGVSGPNSGISSGQFAQLATGLALTGDSFSVFGTAPINVQIAN
jgi:Ca2+-binding RTX toxin-like protein